MNVRRLLFGFAALSLSLLVAAAETGAKDLSNHNNRGMKAVSMGRDVVPRVKKTRVRSYGPKLAKQNSKTLRRLSIRSACAIQDADGFGSCFGGCLRSWGVNYGSGTTCGAICAVAATGNPVAIGVCAGCLGTAEWIVGGCAMRCVWSSSVLEELVEGPVAKGRTRTRQLRAAV